MKNHVSRFVLPGLFSLVLGLVPQLSQAALGDLDTAFTPTLSGSMSSRRLAVQGDGKILIANGSALTRYLPDGSTDAGFACAVSGSSIETLSVAYDGKILIGGSFTTVNGTTANRMARLYPDGSLDPNFSASFNGTVRHICLMPNGKYLVAGAFTTINGSTKRTVARLNANGAIDTTFSTSITGDAYCVAYSNGYSYVCGNLTYSSNAESILGLNYSGGIQYYGPYSDPSVGLIKTIKVLPAGDLLIAGTFQMLDSDVRSCVAMLTSYLYVDYFDAGVVGTEVTSVSGLTSGHILLAGRFDSVDGTSVTNIARVDSMGNYVGAFTPVVGSSTTRITDVAVQGNTNLVVSGNFTTVNATARASVARIEYSNSGPSLSMPSGTAPYGMFWQPNVYIDSAEFGVSDNGGGSWIRYVTGLAVPHTNTAEFYIPDLPESGVIRGLASSQNMASRGSGIVNEEVEYTPHTAGTLDSVYDPDANAIAYASAQQADGKLVVGGLFGTVGGATHTRLVRINTDGTVDSSFTTAVNSSGGEVHAIAIQPDGKILIAGDFTLVNSTTRNRIARLNSDGTLDSGFTATVNAIIYALALQPDGSILIGGEFTSVNSTTRNRIARLTSAGTLDTGFNPNANSHVRTLALQPDGKIVVGGLFGTMGGSTHTRIARLNSDGTLDTGFTTGVSSGGTELVNATAIQADGKILIGGLFTTVNSTSRANLARLNSDGTLDTGFTTVTNGNVYGLSLQTDGQIYAYGHFTSIGGVSRDYFAKLNAAGVVDTGVDASASSYVYGTAVQANGEVVLVGQFLSLQSTTRNRIGRLHNDLPEQKLSVAGFSGFGNRIEWLRGGSLPEAVAVSFEVSYDGGINWGGLGNGTRISGGWALSGVGLSATGKLRARAITRGGKMGSSSGICEVVTDF